MATAVIGAIALVGIALVVVKEPVWRAPGLRGWLDECGLGHFGLSSIALALAAIGLGIAGIVALVVPIPVLAPIGGVAGIAVPIALLDASRTRRKVVAESAWPDIIDALRMAIRSGVPLTDAVRSAESLVPREWRIAWDTLVADLARGAAVRDSMLAFRKERAEHIADRVCESIIVADELGGTEMPRVLEELARSVREDIRVRREATSRQSWVRHAARLGAVAPWTVVIMLGTRPENREAFAGPAGVALLVGCAGATVVAYIVMTAMGKLPEPRRWVRDE